MQPIKTLMIVCTLGWWWWFAQSSDGLNHEYVKSTRSAGAKLWWRHAQARM